VGEKIRDKVRIRGLDGQRLIDLVNQRRAIGMEINNLKGQLSMLNSFMDTIISSYLNDQETWEKYDSDSGYAIIRKKPEPKKGPVPPLPEKIKPEPPEEEPKEKKPKVKEKKEGKKDG
jgi:outer membrane biosynthesis protein TonB